MGPKIVQKLESLIQYSQFYDKVDQIIQSVTGILALNPLSAYDQQSIDNKYGLEFDSYNFVY